ncbi:MAG TPA: RDD family protein [Smithellaceae bacterium]|nr:RDD family protein [Smithellaceae bacterium]
MVLFFDTETTGLPENWKAPVSNVNNWPRMVQLAWLLYDENGNLLNSGNHIIKPEGYLIPLESSRIHGISSQKALHEGSDLQNVLIEFANLIKGSNFLVAHNMSFDEKIIGAEFIRKGISSELFAKRRICTMESTTRFCAIPSNYGFKWPKLSELHYKIFGTGLEDAHDASIDVSVTAKCFWELKKQNLVTFPGIKSSQLNEKINTVSENKIEYAGFWIRLGAALVDLFIIGILEIVISLPFLASSNDPKFVEAITRTLGLITAWLYYSIMESSSSQATFGKQMMDIIVTDELGNRIGFGKATGRFFGKFLSIIIVYIGFIMIGITQKKQGLHDQMAGTLVVKK